MSAAASSWGWDEHQIFPAADMYNQQETLEAVLRQPVMAAPQQQDQAVVQQQQDGVPLLLAAVDDDGAARAAAVTRRRPLRTDRHSKIRTAQGVRDRRMRLSVGVARDFFALQDRLGFDKASKTVNWLLTQSKPAIDRLCDAAAAPAGGPPLVKKGKGDVNSTSTGCCLKDTRERVMRSRGPLDAPVAALMEMEDRHGCELDWNMSEAVAATELTTQPMDDRLEYDHYHQLEELIVRCNNGGVLPR